MNPIFQQFGNSIRFESSEDLRIKFSQLNFDEGRNEETSDFKERYVLREYLRILNDNLLLSFPFEIQKEEHPDFIFIDSAGKKIGVEITEGTTQKYREEIAHSKGIVFLDEFSKKPNPHGGWYGLEAEKEWVEIMTNTVLNKTKNLSKGHYMPANKYELIIYSNTNLPNLEDGDGYKEVRTMLDDRIKSAFQGTSCSTYFEKINIVYGNTLFWLVDYR